jgi:hypothetical protein
MSKRALPTTLEAARAELDRLDRRMRADKQRAEAVREVIGSLHNGHQLPAVGSRWIRTFDLGKLGKSLRGQTRTTEYVFQAYAYPELGSPLLVFQAVKEDGEREGQHSAVSHETFAREFDPAPPAKRKRARSS